MVPAPSTHEDSNHGEPDDDKSSSSSEGSNDPADALFQRSSCLRDMEQADAEARRHEDNHSMTTTTTSTRRTTTTGRTVLLYNDFLQDQRYYDDLKHVDFHLIYYDGGVLVEQDKALGKGGLCWDAAFILSEYLAATISCYDSPAPTTALELGCGTGVCGLLFAAAVAAGEKNDASPFLQRIHLTDLPSLQPLLQRNVQRLLHRDWNDDGIDGRDGCLSQSTADLSRLDLQGFVLDWEDHSEFWPTSGDDDRTYDIVFGADVVATLYDPSALVRTIYRLCHQQSVVYISFKERLSTIHRQFENEMQLCFESIELIQQDGDDERQSEMAATGSGATPSPKLLCLQSRNRNPDVRILIARHKIL